MKRESAHGLRRTKERLVEWERGTGTGHSVVSFARITNSVVGLIAAFS